MWSPLRPIYFSSFWNFEMYYLIITYGTFFIRMTVQWATTKCLFHISVYIHFKSFSIAAVISFLHMGPKELKCIPTIHVDVTRFQYAGYILLRTLALNGIWVRPMIDECQILFTCGNKFHFIHSLCGRFVWIVTLNLLYITIFLRSLWVSPCSKGKWSNNSGAFSMWRSGRRRKKKEFQ